MSLVRFGVSPVADFLCSSDPPVRLHARSTTTSSLAPSHLRSQHTISHHTTPRHTTRHRITYHPAKLPQSAGVGLCGSDRRPGGLAESNTVLVPIKKMPHVVCLHTAVTADCFHHQFPPPTKSDTPLCHRRGHKMLTLFAERYAA
ncbi:unnamed protein product [Protopolystoma xenopodis]|uniref:Uncharacterized protein n=1 Tax=Protopolystoma xenopodis TaxID=117903 RepID=A0A448XFS7_9PLAT|nr:unnamed protein product [Protopolystoma xenopodis]